MCKLMEKIVAKRLRWYLEKNNLINILLLICPKYEHLRSVLSSHLNSMDLRLTMQTLSSPQAFSSLINFVRTSGAIV